MGHPSRIRPRGSNRREFFKRSGGAAVAIGAMPIVAACGGGDDDPPAGGPTGPSVFVHGVASGDPLSDRVILWTRVTPASAGTVQVDYAVATDTAFTNVVRSGRIATDASRDYTVKTDADGLQPGMTYYYRFSAAGFNSPIGRTRTLPVGTTSRLRIAVASCSSLAHGYFNAYRRIAERADLDLVVHLGDYLYEYGSGQYGNVRAYEPANEILTLTDYRTRHAQYKRDADLQEVHRQHPMVAIWDDHEITNDAYLTGAENHTEGAEGVWANRVAAGLQAYYEWMPVRVVDPNNLRKNNRSFALGDLAELVMLEERLNARAQQLTGAITTPFGPGFTQTGSFADASRQLLGTEQEAWLASRLRGSTAKWKLIGQGVMFSQLKIVAGPLSAGGGVFLNPDQWDGYQPVRDRVFDVFKGGAGNAAVGNVVVLTGDIHSSWAADLTQDPNNADTTTGGYNPATGAGSRAVEFVGTSITSPGVNDPQGSTAATLRGINPHFKYIDLNKRGYMLLDVDASRVVCEWWYVDTVATASTGQSFGTAFQVQDATQRLVPATQTAARPNAPALAP